MGASSDRRREEIEARIASIDMDLDMPALPVPPAAKLPRAASTTQTVTQWHSVSDDTQAARLSECPSHGVNSVHTSEVSFSSRVLPCHL